MKRRLILASLLFVIILFGYWYINISGWMTFRKNTDTPEEFLSQTKADHLMYTRDSIEILNQLRIHLSRQDGFFSNKAYSEATDLIVDSILYSPDFRKLGVLIITRNPTYRLSGGGGMKDWYYDATCYLGIKKSDKISLSWIGPVFTNSHDEKSISKLLRESCFRMFVTKDPNDLYAYNLNDKRFWSGPIWREIEKRDSLHREFEREKKEHPENVYDPTDSK